MFGAILWQISAEPEPGLFGPNLRGLSGESAVAHPPGDQPGPAAVQEAGAVPVPGFDKSFSPITVCNISLKQTWAPACARRLSMRFRLGRTRGRRGMPPRAPAPPRRPPGDRRRTLHAGRRWGAGRGRAGSRGRRRCSEKPFYIKICICSFFALIRM